jgi:hypothetical protein
MPEASGPKQTKNLLYIHTLQDTESGKYTGAAWLTLSASIHSYSSEGYDHYGVTISLLCSATLTKISHCSLNPYM